MALQIQKGHTYTPGATVDYTDLNQLVDSAIALKGMIGEQTQVVANTADHVLILDASDSGALKKSLISTLPSGVTTVSVAIDSGASVFQFSVDSPSTTPEIHLGLDSQSQRLFLASPVSGAGVPSFRAIAPEDTASTQTVAAAVINWSLGNLFRKTLTASLGMTFSNPTEGQQITVLINNTGAFNATFPDGSSGVYWAGDTEYASTQGAGRHDILKFHYIGGNYYGNYLLNFLSV